MPVGRKVDRLPSHIRRWLQAQLKERGFSEYVKLTEDLNFMLEEEGIELRLSKTAVHAYGQEFQDYARMQEQAQDEIKAFLEAQSLNDEVDVTSALFQQLTTLQWRLQMAMASPEGLPDPRGMKDLTTALNNLIRSTSLRDEILKAERRNMADKLDAAVESGDLERDAMMKAREIMGFG